MLTNKTHNLILGIMLLLLVDIVWVSSSELTKVRNHDFISCLNVKCFLFQYLYQNEDFDKPFFCTYFKTSLFTIYLIILGLISPWKDSCTKVANTNYTVS